MTDFIKSMIKSLSNDWIVVLEMFSAMNGEFWYKNYENSINTHKVMNKWKLYYLLKLKVRKFRFLSIPQSRYSLREILKQPRFIKGFAI